MSSPPSSVQNTINIALVRPRLPDLNHVASAKPGALQVARLARSEQKMLDQAYKQRMPDGWRFEDGDTLSRLKLFNIELLSSV